MPIHSLSAAISLLIVMNPVGGRQRSIPPESRQPPHVAVSAQAQPARVCPQSASVVAINVVDAAGKPIPGVTVAMTRLRDNTALGNATEMRAGQSEFVLLESDALRWLAPEGERIRLRITHGTRSTTAVIGVGRDATGCKMVQRSGPSVITLK